MSDISKLSSVRLTADLQKNDGKEDAKIREVADMYEKYFMKEMMRNMRSTIQEGGFTKANNAEKIFQEQLDDEYSTQGNQRGGFGVSDMIYQQLTEKFGAQLGIPDKVEKPNGPIPTDKKIKLEELMNTPQAKSYLLHPEQTGTDKNVNVQNPWAGVLQNKNRHEGDKTSYAIKHDNGLESLIMTHGAPSEETRHLSPGDKLEAGQSLGLASTSSPLVWTVKNTVSE
ncbi:flagellar biosynthesis protein FlgJ [Bdellovibrio sp. qaytius]|nr:flagellar biosynthesis protein FlgJ [Bdellovibrio sp. qaytius]